MKDLKLLLKALTITALIVGSIVLVVKPTWAATGTMNATWTYPTDIPSDLAGFRIYVDGVVICDVADPLARSTTCTGTFPDGAGVYTMTAYDIGGNESAHSLSVTYDPKPQSPGGLELSFGF